MGADGGSIPDRRDLVKTKGRAEITDKALLRDLFLLCALSKKPLTKPVVADPLGKLYNKDAVLEYLIDKSAYGDGDQICGYLKGVKDLLTLNLMPNPSVTIETITSTSTHLSRAPFVCPLTLKEMSGSLPFIALRPCGCVFSEAAIRSVIPSLTRGINPTNELPDDAKPIVPTSTTREVNCPNCGKPFDPSLTSSTLPINPSREIQDTLLETLLLARASTKSKKRKAATETTTTTTIDSNSNPNPTKVKKSAPTPAIQAPLAPSIKASTVGGSVKEKLAEQERKRIAAQEGMSEAVRSMFKPKDKTGDHHQGNADFFGRTFTRYAA